MKTLTHSNLYRFGAALLIACASLLLLTPASVQGADGFTIMSYNVRNGRGLDDVRDLSRAPAVILAEGADVVAIQELDQKTKRSEGVDVLEEYAKQTKMYPSYGPAIDYQGGKYGVGILTKEKPIKFEYFPLPGTEEQRCLLVVELEKFVFCCSHWSLTKADRAKTVGIVTAKMKECKKPVVICGDFNVELDEDSIKELDKDWTRLNSDELTFPADEPTVHIDYICGADPTGKRSPEDWKNAVVETHVVPEKVASDHRPVVVTLKPDFL